MFEKIYKNSIIEKPKSTLLFLIVVLLSFGYFSKDFQLDASSDTLLLENDPDLKYMREISAKYGMNPRTAYEVTIQSATEFTVWNKKHKASAHFLVNDVYEVTPEENPEYFL